MKTPETLKIEAIVHEQRQRILELAVQHGAKNVRIFGSVVRGEAQPNSDIDLLIDLGDPLSPWFPVGLIHDLEALLGRKVDVVTEKSLHYMIRDRILKEAQLL
ncbi:DNA polymerase beta domain-containing protein [Gloeomargarita lithophora Alchichica-D10]|uniref:DNA polymerase beta domain-containing protein n=1 Tax=Gloeomargarita lithophora Alchichica-D10 TaxID=1188229 RepID=A0A1J0AFC7_9CYAN|nr:nucleotidyltransferase family protein [Gloeomargarita lithophora]APB34642.1 DNA polymerase beta domain-containing protein [Gloeomargarita lithophora Alchichica-D10]